MELDFLQSVKLEISRTFTLNAYERIAMHKVLGIEKSKNGMNILLKDAEKKHLIRESALNILKDFDYPEVNSMFSKLFEGELTDSETEIALEYFEKFGVEENIDIILKFIEERINKPDFFALVYKSIHILGKMAKTSEVAVTFLKTIAANRENNIETRGTALEMIYFTKDIALFETLLTEKNEQISSSIYKALAKISEEEFIKYEMNATDDIYTVIPPAEDRLLLEIRVILSKMTPFFDNYSNETRTSFILAMLTSVHREFLVFTMKALTSNDPNLIDMTLYIILANINSVRFPDKLFRNLISLPSLTNRDDDLIIEIFIKFFKGLKDTRSNHLLKDKIYNYITIMLDTFFESYRKNFMIPEIMEKDYPVEFQKIRNMILSKFTPELKRKIITYLGDPDFSIKNILFEISEKVAFIEETMHDSLQSLIEVLCDTDNKAREITANRINNIDFEKKYLKNKLIRICKIIGRLNISESSTSLVKIFNYIKKYNDNDIFDSVVYSLSLLNYPYMLGEFEVGLSTEGENKLNIVRYLSLFSDQRSLNIMLEYLKLNCTENSELINKMLFSVSKRDITKNKLATETAKLLFEKNRNSQIKKQALQILGKTRDESFIDFLNETFNETSDPLIKEGVVQAFDFMAKNVDVNVKMKIVRFLKEYLKDPGIKVRIYACSVLLKLGDKSSLQYLRDMMIIKNKAIQREILNIVGSYIPVEFAFFLLSILKEEYCISNDIIPLLYFLEKEDKQEIDHFVVNLFKKIEGSDYNYQKTDEYIEYKQQIRHFIKEDCVIFTIKILKYHEIITQYQFSDLSINYNQIYSNTLKIIADNEGEISQTTGGQFSAYFRNSLKAANAAIDIIDYQNKYNSFLVDDEQVKIIILLDYKKIDMVNQEIIFYTASSIPITNNQVFAGKIILNDELFKFLDKTFKCNEIPFTAFDDNGQYMIFKELLNRLNFAIIVDDILMNIREEEKKKIELQLQIESGMQSIKRKPSDRSVAMSRNIDDLSKMLKKDLNEINKFVYKRSTDRELINSVEKMLMVAYNHFLIESSKIIIE